MTAALCSKIMRFILRSGDLVTVKPDETLGQQIIICGVLLVLQLLGGEVFKSELFEDEIHSLQTFDFRKIENQIVQHVLAA